MFTTLIDGATLVSQGGEPGWIAVDCRAALGDPDYGRIAYREGHVPGARYADLDRDLAGSPGKRGRHPLPGREALAGRFAAWGIRHGDQLVAYDDAGGQFACRFWWLARWLGVESCTVLDGGLAAYLDAGGELTRDVPAVEASAFRPGPPLTRVVEADGIIAAGSALTIIDARAGARYRGEEEPIDRVAGHIPGALSYPCADNLDATGRFRRTARRFDALAGHDVVSYCGSGVTATHNILAMVDAGLAEPALYPGSWSEWIEDPDRPVATVGRGE